MSRSAALLAAILLSIPAILAVDLFLTPWRVPTRILYAIPIMVAARMLGVGVAIGVVVVAVVFSVLDAWLLGIDVQTEALSLLALVAIGLLSILWARAERRSARLAEERVRMHQEEQRRAAELEESRARLLDFFSMVAHDLRTPLTAIQGYSQMLSRWDSLSPAQRERIASGMETSTRRMVRLSDDLADASRIGTGRFEISRAPCDLLAVCREVVEQRRAAAMELPLALEARVERIEGALDCDRIAQAVANLVDNAIKYSPARGEVRVAVERVGDRGRVVVTDQGIGITPEDARRLFQPYARLRRVSGARGLGLGLYIVRGIAEAHGGTVVVESEPGKGSTFILELPLEGSA